MKRNIKYLITCLVILTILFISISLRPTGHVVKQNNNSLASRSLVDNDTIANQDKSKQAEIQRQKEQIQIGQEEKKTCEVGYLDEYRCDGNNIQRKYQHSNCSFSWVFNELCSYGCENAKCKPCEDTDNGKDYHTKGYIYYSVKGKVYDECDTNVGYENYLIEYYCKNSKLDSEYYKCPYGCSEGKCNPEPENASNSGGSAGVGCGCKDDNICATNECKDCPDCSGYIVTRVIDGDTIELNTGEKVRLLEINSAESGQPCYQEAKDSLGQLVLNKEVTLEKDVEDKDRYDRLLRYIYVGDTFVNLALVREGLATVWIISPNVKYETQMKQAEAEAKQDATGCLWKRAKEDYSDCFVISNFHYDAYGNDNYNLNDEYVTLKNTCSFPVDMISWTISDLANHVYTFPTFNLYPQTSVTLYTGSGTNTAEKLYWGSTSAVWNNDGDTFYLRDANNNLVLQGSYS